MIRLCFTVIIILYSGILTSGFAQRSMIIDFDYDKNETDSLFQLTLRETDLFKKVDYYKSLCWKLRDRKAEKEALFYADEGIKLAQEIGYKKAEADITRFKGIISWNFKHSNESFDLYKKALALSAEIGDQEGIAYAHDRLGITAFYKKQYTVALSHFKKALAIFKATKNEEGIGYVLSHYNWVLAAIKKYDKALLAANVALSVRQRINNPTAVASSLGDLALTYMEFDADSAIVYFIPAVAYARKHQLEPILSEYIFFLASLYNSKGDHEKALHLAHESLSLATKNRIKNQVQENSKMLAGLYELKKDYPQAYKYLQIYHSTKDSIFNEDINRRLVEQEFNYNYEKEKQAAQDKNRLLRVVFIAVAMVVLIGIVGITYRMRVRQLLKVENLRRKISNDLHDNIGATLCSINIYSELAKKSATNIGYINTIQEHVVQTVGTLDDLVWSIKPANDRLKVLVERMRTYALPILNDNNIKAEFLVELKDGNYFLSLERKRGVYFAFKEMITNVLKHANCTQCFIHISQSKAGIQIKVTDNGNGFDLHNIKENRNGLQGLRTRAAEFGGNFTLQSVPGQGTTCTFSAIIKSRRLAMVQ